MKRVLAFFFGLVLTLSIARVGASDSIKGPAHICSPSGKLCMAETPPITVVVPTGMVCSGKTSTTTSTATATSTGTLYQTSAQPVTCTVLSTSTVVVLPNSTKTWTGTVTVTQTDIGTTAQTAGTIPIRDGTGHIPAVDVPHASGDLSQPSGVCASGYVLTSTVTGNTSCYPILSPNATTGTGCTTVNLAGGQAYSCDTTARVASNTAITASGATNKIVQYDTKGLVLSGVDATPANIGADVAGAAAARAAPGTCPGGQYASATTTSGVTCSTPSGSGYTLPAATASTLGGVKCGSGITCAGDGTASVSTNYLVPNGQGGTCIKGAFSNGQLTGCTTPGPSDVGADASGAAAAAVNAAVSGTSGYYAGFSSTHAIGSAPMSYSGSTSYASGSMYANGSPLCQQNTGNCPSAVALGGDAAGAATSAVNAAVSGTLGYVARFTGTNSVGNAAMYSLTPGSLTIPIADVSGHLDGWVSHAATVLVHEERFTAGTYYTATAPQVLVGFTTSISSYSVSASAVVANGSSMACDAFLAIKNGSTTLAVRHGGVNPGYNTNLSVTELATVTPGTDITLYFYSNSASCTVNVSAGDANMVAIPATPF